MCVCVCVCVCVTLLVVVKDTNDVWTLFFKPKPLVQFKKKNDYSSSIMLRNVRGLSEGQICNSNNGQLV